LTILGLLKNPSCPKSLDLGVAESLRIRLPKSTPRSPQKVLFLGTTDAHTNREIPFLMKGTQFVIAKCRETYNEIRSNFALDYSPPAPAACES
jgi:hypothetical protein